MHELAITESIVSGVAERAAGARVVRVILEVGKLAAVVPDSIRFCFEACAQGTSVQGAALEIRETAGGELLVKAIEVEVAPGPAP